MKTIMVVGASGILGHFVCEELLRMHEKMKIIVTDYKVERGKHLSESFHGSLFRKVDVRDESSIRSALNEVDAVIVVVKQDCPTVQKICSEEGVACIDVTVDKEFAKKVRSLSIEKTVSIVMAGFFPGLSGLLVKEAYNTFDKLKTLDVALLQNTNAKAGATGISDMLHIVAQTIDGKPGFKEKRKMVFGSSGFEQEVREIDHTEKRVLQTELTIPELRYWTAWNEASFNKKIASLKNFGLMKWLANRKKLLGKLVTHNPLENEKAYLTAKASGWINEHYQEKSWRLSVNSDYQTTAKITAVLTHVVLKKQITGVKYPFEMVNLKEVLDKVSSEEIHLSRIEGG